MSKPSKVITIEEHFTTADFVPEIARLAAALAEIGEKRLAAMDRAGIDMQVLSLTSPGVQGETDAAIATAKSKRANDILAELTHKHPTRFSGFACLPTQDPKAAADELERAVRQLGLKGALINAHTHGHYLDESQFFPIWERAEALDVPIYLHPGTAQKSWDLTEGYPELASATWGWAAETGAHALRIICSGLFDRFPGARLLIGHMGEGIPYFLWRIDSRLHGALQKKGLKKTAPEYFRGNVMITTSGMFDDPPLLCAIAALGIGSVMFSADYPHEDEAVAMAWLNNLSIPQDQIEALAHGNAERVLKL